MSQSSDLFCYFPTFNDDGVTEGINLEIFQTIPVPNAFWTFCQEHGISSFHLLAAGWAVILKVYTGGNQVLFGAADGTKDGRVTRCCVDVESNHPPLVVVGEILNENHPPIDAGGYTIWHLQFSHCDKLPAIDVAVSTGILCRQAVDPK